MTLTKPFAAYPHTKRAGGLVFLAGQGCRDPETDGYPGTEISPTGEVLSYDIRSQTSGVLQNIERALASEGLKREDLVDVTVFLTDMQDFAGMNEVWNQWFSEAAGPTRTTVAVRKLPGHNQVEMKAIAIDGRATPSASKGYGYAVTTAWSFYWRRIYAERLRQDLCQPGTGNRPRARSDPPWGRSRHQSRRRGKYL